MASGPGYDDEWELHLKKMEEVVGRKKLTDDALREKAAVQTKLKFKANVKKRSKKLKDEELDGDSGD